MADLFNNVLLKGATGQPIYPQTLMDNVYVQAAANGTVEGQQTLREWLALNYVGLSILTATSLESITDPKLNIIYFIPSDDAEAGSYILYIYHKGPEGTALGTFLAIGSTDLDLSGYVTLLELADALTNYYTKSEADAKFIDTELIKNYYTVAEIGYLDDASARYTTTSTVSARIKAVEELVDALNTFKGGADAKYVLVTDLSAAAADATAANKTYAVSIANQVGATWLSTTATKTQLDTLTTGGKNYALPVEQKVMDVISTMGVDGATSANNWLFKAIANLGFVTSAPADDPSTAPYIVASTTGFGYWFDQTLAAVNDGSYSGTSFLTSFNNYLGPKLTENDDLALYVLQGVATAIGGASEDNNVASDVLSILDNVSTYGALVVNVTDDYKTVGLHVPDLFYVAGDIEGTYNLRDADNTRTAFVTAVNNSIFFTKLHKDCTADVVLVLGDWFENNQSTDATHLDSQGSGGAGLAERAGNGIGAACLDTATAELATERMAKNWSLLTSVPQNLADSLIKFLALHNFMYYEVILEDTQD